MLGAVFQPLTHSLRTLSSVARDLVHLLVLVSRSRRALAAENLFLRKQLAMFQERKVKPHRADDSTRLIMVILGRLFAWRDALVNVQPDTFVRWHRKGFRLLWRWNSRPVGRPRIPKDLRRLIHEMAAENPTWGEERIANELKLKLAIRLSPRTVGKYLHSDGPVRKPDPKQRWLTFVRNHAKVMVACDFFVVITATWAIHYNRGRPHAALGPGLPEPMSDEVPSNEHRHSLPIGYRVVKKSVLGGLHHEYGLMKEAA
jgi:hypothetical protein